MSVSYRINYKCRNCFGWIYLDIPFQTEAPTYLICPVCGLNELSKTEKRPEQNVYPSIYEYDVKTEEIKEYE